jgi:Arc/MetJ-type ribon-helix-helix transcriptional regulator
MKTNLNVSVEKSVMNAAKIAAIKRGVSISEVVRAALVNLSQCDEFDSLVKNDQSKLDEMKLSRAKMVISRFRIDQIREKSLSNLARWKSQGVWCSAYDEWTRLMESGDDIEVMESMVGMSENSNRLRQSPPYVGMMDKKELDGIREKAAS